MQQNKRLFHGKKAGFLNLYYVHTKQFPKGQFLLIGRFENAFSRSIQKPDLYVFGSFLKY